MMMLAAQRRGFGAAIEKLLTFPAARTLPPLHSSDPGTSHIDRSIKNVSALWDHLLQSAVEKTERPGRVFLAKSALTKLTVL